METQPNSIMLNRNLGKIFEVISKEKEEYKDFLELFEEDSFDLNTERKDQIFVLLEMVLRTSNANLVHLRKVPESFLFLGEKEPFISLGLILNNREQVATYLIRYSAASDLFISYKLY